MSYIKKEPLLQIAKELQGNDSFGAPLIVRAIEEAPEEDAAAVVKCTHCKHCKYDTYWHELYCSKMSDDEHIHWVPVGFYCGYGEEIEDE